MSPAPLSPTLGPARPTPRRTARLLVTAAALAGLLLSWAGRPAGAHGEEGVMEITELSATGLTVTVEVGIVYANDDDPAEEATVTLAAAGPDGADVGPVDVPNVTSGRYGTTFEVPTAGDWTVTLTAIGPDAEVVETIEVTGDTTTTTLPTTDAPTSAPVDPTPPSTTTPPAAAGPTAAPEDATSTTGLPPTTGPETNAADTTDDESTDIVPLVLLAALAILVIGLTVYLVRRSRGDGSTPGSGDSNVHRDERSGGESGSDPIDDAGGGGSWSDGGGDGGGGD